MKKKMSRIACVSCGKYPLTKDEIGINQKLLGTGCENYYCLTCLACDLEVTEQDILDKIQQFKEEGCTLFQ